jgi:hypothetical protein
MVALIPSLKQCVKRCMTDKQYVLLSEFDRMLKDYQNHQGEIHAKLIAIMNERFDVHKKSMQVRSLLTNSRKVLQDLNVIKGDQLGYGECQ